MKRAIAVAVVALVLGACATAPVQPWQKGILAKRSMALDADPLKSKFENHLYFGKEAANGGEGVGGGGCGCN
jgi:hypothetical protein